MKRQLRLVWGHKKWEWKNILVSGHHLELPVQVARVWLSADTSEKLEKLISGYRNIFLDVLRIPQEAVRPVAECLISVQQRKNNIQPTNIITFASQNLA